MDLLDSQEDFELFLTEDHVGNVEAIYGSYRLSSVYQPSLHVMAASMVMKHLFGYAPWKLLNTSLPI